MLCTGTNCALGNEADGMAQFADTDVVVVGGGAIGLAIGRALALRGRDVMVLEKNAQIGMETSSRNSEVVHAGLYYQPGSHRSRFCVRGKALLYAFVAEAGVPIEKCGKLLVATSEAEEAKLSGLQETAKQNGVLDLEPISATQARALEPELFCTAACFSPSTGVIDSHRYMQALDGHISSLGGMVVLNTRVTGVARCANGLFSIETESGGSRSTLTATTVVLAGGLNASALARRVPFGEGYVVPETYFAKGHYFSLSGRAPFTRLVYPMPSGSWLGVHFTRDVSGRAKFGPDFEWVDAIDYTFDDRAGARRDAFEAAVRRYWPGLPARSLQPDYTGIRPKVSPENSATIDFLIHGPDDHGLDGVVALYGIDSPGLTSSLAIADYVSELLIQ